MNSTHGIHLPSVLITGTSSDAHTWNLIFLQLLLEEWGHDVINLGPCAPDELVLRSALEQRPDLLVVSSVNGHGHQDGLRLVRTLRGRPQLAATTMVIGGKLGTDGLRDLGQLRRLLDAGYDRVFDDGDVASFHALVSRLPVRAAS
ncbi:cobalamin B12-binding domain-containing protein [Streptomyces griseorubiginosus]|uniref:cobalamin B12-binding domain-containing protein n=1 Tax=Streptomyces griseorubiginosus TaxID=67304 RepID=UPI001AD7CFF5|nr:cobalamin-dependent protein [Streptomyces griseorubiginosus]MBO4254981.1 methylmalonyl-CoA mutase [Streptomyces griseorubiginosus]